MTGKGVKKTKPLQNNMLYTINYHKGQKTSDVQTSLTGAYFYQHVNYNQVEIKVAEWTNKSSLLSNQQL